MIKRFFRYFKQYSYERNSFEIDNLPICFRNKNAVHQFQFQFKQFWRRYRWSETILFRTSWKLSDLELSGFAEFVKSEQHRWSEHIQYTWHSFHEYSSCVDTSAHNDVLRSAQVQYVKTFFSKEKRKVIKFVKLFLLKVLLYLELKNTDLRV